MSLLADVFTADGDGEPRFLDVPEGPSDPAGFESRRTTVRGSGTVRPRGARFFPRPAGDELRVPPQDVAEFIGEVLLFQGDIESIAVPMDPPKPVAQRVGEISDRLDSILDAAHRASQIRGGVRNR
ncbi:hypothetical protein [Kitasatospora sp. NPDC056181]|uniref:hypothetical protein n=1 Tax=Kitasatospora sp. NPDC056181 TaxID=3345737 RepID=UPI0035DBCB66